jgi:hypothetical protein
MNSGCRARTPSAPAGKPLGQGPEEEFGRKRAEWAPQRGPPPAVDQRDRDDISPFRAAVNNPSSSAHQGRRSQPARATMTASHQAAACFGGRGVAEPGHPQEAPIDGSLGKPACRRMALAVCRLPMPPNADRHGKAPARDWTSPNLVTDPSLVLRDRAQGSPWGIGRRTTGLSPLAITASSPQARPRSAWRDGSWRRGLSLSACGFPGGA